MSGSKASLPELPEFTMITNLLRLTSTLQSENGDISMPEYGPAASKSGQREHMVKDLCTRNEAEEQLDLLGLDAVSALLVRNDEIVSACYTTKERIVLTTGGMAPLEDEDRITSSLMIAEDRSAVNTRFEELSSRMKGAKSILPLQMTTLCNPTGPASQDADFTFSVLPKGNDYWPEIRDSDNLWHCAEM